MSRNKFTTLLMVFLLIPIYLQSACMKATGETTYEEITRIKSSDNKYEAVLVSATTDVIGNNSHYLYIVPTGRKFDVKDVNFSRRYLNIRCFEGLQLIWQDPKILEVQYKEALIEEFRNCVNLTEDPESPFIVELRLTPLTTFALPGNCPCLK